MPCALKVIELHVGPNFADVAVLVVNDSVFLIAA